MNSRRAERGIITFIQFGQVVRAVHGHAEELRPCEIAGHGHHLGQGQGPTHSQIAWVRRNANDLGTGPVGVRADQELIGPGSVGRAVALVGDGEYQRNNLTNQRVDGSRHAAQSQIWRPEHRKSRIAGNGFIAGDIAGPYPEMIGCRGSQPADGYRMHQEQLGIQGRRSAIARSRAKFDLGGRWFIRIPGDQHGKGSRNGGGLTENRWDGVSHHRQQSGQGQNRPIQSLSSGDKHQIRAIHPIGNRNRGGMVGVVGHDRGAPHPAGCHRGLNQGGEIGEHDGWPDGGIHGTVKLNTNDKITRGRNRVWQVHARVDHLGQNGLGGVDRDQDQVGCVQSRKGLHPIGDIGDRQIVQSEPVKKESIGPIRHHQRCGEMTGLAIGEGARSRDTGQSGWRTGGHQRVRQIRLRIIGGIGVVGEYGHR